MVAVNALERIRQQFPVTKRMLYLDSAHQTPMASCVREALAEFLAEGTRWRVQNRCGCGALT
jgi:selenocysteine lyase/cysteine desulfurase